MGKRTMFDDGTDGPEPKRYKSSHDQHGLTSESTTITSCSQLRKTLTFHQDEAPHKRKSIQAFKMFLEVIAHGEESARRSRNRDMLLEFAKSEVTQVDEGNIVYLSGLMQSWSFAAQSDNEGLLSAIPACLALLLKTISSLIECREFGIQVCKTLLRRDQLKLFSKGLSANKSKEFLISPCLRLLTEIVSFDGGVLGKRLYLQRETTFKRLEFFLGMSKPTSIKDSVFQQKPSVRSNAVRYLLANLKLQAVPVISDVISQSRLARALFQSIGQDLPGIAIEIMEVCQQSIANNPELTLISKSRFFNESTLLRLCELRDQHNDITEAEGESCRTVSSRAQELLLSVCSHFGFNDQASHEGEDTRERDTFRTFPPSPGGDSAGRDRRPKSAIASFMQHLKPFSNILDKDLILEAFRATPDLVADYFSKKKSFSYDPKLSATWIGYSAFLYAVVELPLPDNILQTVPAKPRDVIDHLLPEPLNRKCLERSLNQKHPLIKLLAARLLVKALQKLDILRHLKDFESGASSNTSLSRLQHEFCQQIPEIAVVTAAYREACNTESPSLRETLVRLISLYYIIVPQMVREDKFDISLALADRLSSNNKVSDSDGQKSFRVLELDSFLEIALRSSEMRWWQNPEEMALSPFTTILQLYAESDDIKITTQKKVRHVLESTTSNNYIVSQMISPTSQVQSALDALIVSLRCFRESSCNGAIYKFLDNCLCRLVRKPVNYESNRQEFNGAQNRMPTSLLAVVFAEQCEFMVKSASGDDIEVTAGWMILLLRLLMGVGEDPSTINRIFHRIRNSMPDDQADLFLHDTLYSPFSEKHQRTIEAYLKALQPVEMPDETQDKAKLQTQRIEDQILSCTSPDEATNHPELYSWAEKDPLDTIDDGTLGRLIMCLCSTHEEVRRQALNSMKRFMSILKASEFSDWQLVFVLLGEIVESVEEVIPLEPLPHFAGELGSRMLQVLADPLHFMYVKVCQFLTKRSQWDLPKLPSRWLVKVILHPPTEEGHRWQEIHWVLLVVYHGLRTPEDMESYRRCNIFERIFSASNSRSWPNSCDDLLWQIVCRCTFVDGSTTLITRYGILSWIKMRQQAGQGDKALLDAIRTHLLRTSDLERTAGWRH